MLDGAHRLLVGVYKAEVQVQERTYTGRKGGAEKTEAFPTRRFASEGERHFDLPGARKEATANTPSVRPSLVMRRMVTLCSCVWVRLRGCECVGEAQRVPEFEFAKKERK